MSKTETVRRLNDCGPQLQIVASVRSLEHTMAQMREDLAQLPQGVATETAQALEPLDQLRQDVRKALEAYDQVTAIQRKTLDELTQEVTRKATEAFGRQAQALAATTADLQRATQQVAAMADQLQPTERHLAQQANRMQQWAETLRPRLWRQVLALVLAGVLGGLLVLIGHSVSERLLQPGDVRQKAVWAEQVWAKATPQERELLKQIVGRPEP